MWCSKPNRRQCPDRPGTGVPRTLQRWSRATIVPLLLAIAGLAQDPSSQEPQPPPGPKQRATFFEHSQTSRWWVSGQANIVFQAHGGFYAQYSGPNSLKNHGEHATSRVLTLFTGFEFTPYTVGYFDVEEAGWGGHQRSTRAGRLY